MGKGIKRPAKANKPEFNKKKLKVGRKLTKQANETKIDVRVAKLSLPTVSIDSAWAAGEETPGPGKEALRKLAHHNSKIRKSALRSLTSVVQHSLRTVTGNLGDVFESSIACLLDEDQEVRAAFLAFWQECVQKSMSQEAICPFLPLLMANIRSASSHLNLALRLDAMKFLQILIAHCPQAVVLRHTASLIQLFVDTLSQKHQERSLAARAFSATVGSISTLEDALSHLCVAHEFEYEPAMLATHSEMSFESSRVSFKIAQGGMEVPGVLSFVLTGAEETPGTSRVRGYSQAEGALSLCQALFARLQSCWDDCGPLQAVACVDEIKLSCMARILNCMCLLYGFVGSVPGLDHPLKQGTSAFVNAKVLECFPVDSTAGSSAKQSESIRKLNAFGAWTFANEGCSRNAVAVCGGVSRTVDSSDAMAPERMIVCLLKYCSIAIKASRGTGSGVLDEPRTSAMQLREALSAARRILDLLRGEHRWALIEDITDVMTSPMPATKLDVCAQLALHTCLVSAEARSTTPLPPQTLQAWVTGLSGTFVEQKMTDCGTLELLLQCNLCLCRMSGPRSDGSDKLLRHAVGLVLIYPSPSMPRSLQALVTQICSYKRLTQDLCSQLCEALEEGKLCPGNRIIIAHTLQAAV